MPFEELPHQADVRVRVTAASCDALFAEAARAMFSIMYVACGEGGIERRVSVSAPDMPQLMVDFLSVALYRGGRPGGLLGVRGNGEGHGA
jgi:SHS2 domain-containing protein